MNWLINFIKSIFSKKTIIKTIPKEDGLIPSPVDFRDIKMGAVLGEGKITPIPPTFVIPYKLRIKHQGTTPHCVGYTCATIKEYLERKEGNDIEFDGDWIYRKCKEIDGIPNVKGTYFRAGLKTLQKFGAKPINGNEVEAEKYRIGGYIRVNCDFDSLKRAIYEFGAILVGFQGSNQGWKTAFIRAPLLGEKIWGHASAGIGYQITYINGQNSWSENWGDKGLFYFTKNYLPFEAWAPVVDLPNNWKELLVDEKTKPVYTFVNNLWIGLKNDEITVLQDCLKYLGCMEKEQASTGYFGSITLEAVKIFQQRYNISPQSGYVGPLTRAKLNEIFGIYESNL